MWDWIERQRKKSRAERTRLTFMMSVVFTGIVALVWGTVVLPRTLNMSSVEQSRANASTPFKTLLENFNVITSDAKKGFESIQEVFDKGLSSSEEKENEVDTEDNEDTMPEQGSIGEVVSEVVKEADASRETQEGIGGEEQFESENQVIEPDNQEESAF